MRAMLVFLEGKGLIYKLHINPSHHMMKHTCSDTEKNILSRCSPSKMSPSLILGFG